jgi:hypothetical protein
MLHHMTASFAATAGKNHTLHGISSKDKKPKRGALPHFGW